MPDKKHFFLKLNPPRPSFALDMTDEERSIMKSHIAYWQPYAATGTVVALGPVADPKGVYGIAVVAVDDEQEVTQLVASDPATVLGNYEIYPMPAVMKKA
jgi:uncharacterized protein